MESHTHVLHETPTTNSNATEQRDVNLPHGDSSGDSILQHWQRDIKTISPLLSERQDNVIYILRYFASIAEEDPDSTDIISPDPRHIAILERNLEILPYKEIWHLLLYTLKHANEARKKIARKYMKEKKIQNDSTMEEYAAWRNLLWSMVMGSGGQFRQSKSKMTKKILNKKRTLYSLLDGTSRFYCLPMASRCNLLHLKVSSKKSHIVQISHFSEFHRQVDMLPQALRNTYNTFYADVGENLTIQWIEWLTLTAKLKPDSVFIQNLCLVTFYHLVSYFIECGFDTNDKLKDLITVPCQISTQDWLEIFSSSTEESSQSKFAFLTECYAKWYIIHTSKHHLNVSVEWNCLILSCMAFVKSCKQMNTSKDRAVWSEVTSIYNEKSVDMWILRRGFAMPIDSMFIKFLDSQTEVFRWSAPETHFVAMVFMALGSIQNKTHLDVEYVFQKEIELLKDTYAEDLDPETVEMTKEIYSIDPTAALKAANVMKELQADTDSLAIKGNMPMAYEAAESVISLMTVTGGGGERSGTDERESAFANTLNLIHDLFTKDKAIHDIVSIAKEHESILSQQYLLTSFHGDTGVVDEEEIDAVSASIYPDDAPAEMSPQSVYGDGNCLFRSFSLLCFGVEDRHKEMRCRAVLELLCNMDFYLSTKMLPKEKEPRKTFGIITAICISDAMQGEDDKKGLVDVIRQSTRVSDWSTVSFWHVAALASVCQRRVRSIYPAQKVGIGKNIPIRHLLNRVINPRVMSPKDKPPFYIMWTNVLSDTQSNGGNWRPNHFVPCLPLTSGSVREEFDECGIPKSMKREIDEDETVDNADVVVLSSDEEEGMLDDGQRMTETLVKEDDEEFLDDGQRMTETLLSDTDTLVGDDEEVLYTMPLQTLDGSSVPFDENIYGCSTQIPMMMNTPEFKKSFDVKPKKDQPTEQSDKTIIYSHQSNQPSRETDGSCTIDLPLHTPEFEKSFDVKPPIDQPTEDSDKTIIYSYQSNDPSRETDGSCTVDLPLHTPELDSPGLNENENTSKEDDPNLTMSKICGMLTQLEHDLNCDTQGKKQDEKQKKKSKGDRSRSPNSDVTVISSDSGHELSGNFQQSTFCDEKEWQRKRPRHDMSETQEIDVTSISHDATVEDDTEPVYIPPQNTFEDSPESMDDEKSSCGSWSQSLLNETVDYTVIGDAKPLDEKTKDLSPISKRKFDQEEEEEASSRGIDPSKTRHGFRTSTPIKARGHSSMVDDVRRNLFKKQKKIEDELATREERTADFVMKSSPTLETVEGMRKNNETLMRALQEEKDKNLQLANQYTILKKEHNAVIDAKESEARRNKESIDKVKEMVLELDKTRVEEEKLHREVKANMIKEMETLKSDNQNLSHHLKQFEDRMKAFEKKDTENFTENERLKNQLEATKRDASSEIRKLQDEMKKDKDQLNEVMDHNGMLQKQANERLEEMKSEYERVLQEKVKIIAEKEKEEEQNKVMAASRLNEMEHEKKSFSSELARSMDHCRQLEKRVEEKDSIIQHLQLNTSVEQNNHVELMETNNLLEANIQDLQIQVNGLTKALHEKECELQDVTSRAELAGKQMHLTNAEQVKAMNEMENKFQTQLVVAKQLEAELALVKKKASSDVSMLESALEQTNQELERERNVCTSMGVKLSDFKKDISKKESEYEVAMTRKRHELKKLTENNRHLKAEAAELEKVKYDLAEAKVRIRNFESEKTEKEGELQAKDRRIKQLEKNVRQGIDEDREENETLRQQVANAKAQKESNQKQLATMNLKCAKLEEETEELVKDRESLEEKANRYEKEISQLKTRLNLIKNESQEKENDVQIKDKKIRHLTKILNEQSSEEDTGDNERLREEAKSAKVQAEKSQKDYIMMAARCTLLEQEKKDAIKRNETERDTLQKKVSCHEKEISQLKNDLTEAKSDAEVQRDSLNPLIEQNEKLRDEREKLILELDRQSLRNPKIEKPSLRSSQRIATKVKATQTAQFKEEGVQKADVTREIEKVVTEFSRRLGKHHVAGDSKHERELGDIAEMLQNQWNCLISSIKDFGCKQQIDENFAKYMRSVLADIRHVMDSVNITKKNTVSLDELEEEMRKIRKELDEKETELRKTKHILDTSESEKVLLSSRFKDKEKQYTKLCTENDELREKVEYWQNEVERHKQFHSELEREANHNITSGNKERCRLECQLEKVTKRMQGMEKELIERNGEIAHLQWKANQKEKRFSLLSDQVTTLTRMGGVQGISEGWTSVSGKSNGGEGRRTTFVRYTCRGF